MHLTADGLAIGPALVNWTNLSWLLGVLTWLGLAKFPLAQPLLLVILVVARIFATTPGLSADRPWLENLLDLVDIRRGDWAWGPGLLAGLVYLTWWSWRDVRRVSRQRAQVGGVAIPATELWQTTPWPAALKAGLAAVALASLPYLLKPVPEDLHFPSANLLDGDGRQVRMSGPAVVNLWASWCGPCRSEMPMLLAEARHDRQLILLNVSEDVQTVRQFLSPISPLFSPDQVWLGGEQVTGPLKVTGFPITLVLNRQGKVIARHLGPLTRAQLLNLQELARQP